MKVWLSADILSCRQLGKLCKFALAANTYVSCFETVGPVLGILVLTWCSDLVI